MEQQGDLILFLLTSLSGKHTEDGKQKKAIGYMKIVYLMSDSQGIGSQKECNDTEDYDGNRKNAEDPGNCRK
jgi:hypothetical protein